jgi:hypothetical protein
MQSFDFQAVLNCPLHLVFRIYTDVERWQNRNLFGDIRWVEGKPWEKGSRLHIEARVPFRTTVEQVVRDCVPNERVSYRARVHGIRCETRVTFVRVSEQQTAVNIAMELDGTATRALEFAVEPFLVKSTRSFLSELRKDCESAARNLRPQGE